MDRQDGYRGLWSKDLRRAIEGPDAPGALAFLRWLFAPIRSPTPPAPPSEAEAEAILAALDELERRRGVPEKYRIGPVAEVEIEALNEVLSAAMHELDMGFEAAVTWAATRPLTNFDGQTAVQLIARGQKATVLYYLRSVGSGFTG